MNKHLEQLRLATDDPVTFFSRILKRLNTLWLRKTYCFVEFNSRVFIHHSCDISRTSSQFIKIGSDVSLAQDVWLNVVVCPGDSVPKMILGKGCNIGRRSTISSRNRIELQDDVLLAPSVLIMDHSHEYSDPQVPIHSQGVTKGGTITIGKNCWLGYGAAIICAHGELIIGQNSVVGANSVVTKSFPAYSVIAGNPAKLVKTYDPASGKWTRVDSRP